MSSPELNVVRGVLPIAAIEQPNLAHRIAVVAKDLTNAETAIPDLTELKLEGIPLLAPTGSPDERLKMSLFYSAQNLGLGSSIIYVDGDKPISKKMYKLTEAGQAWERYSPRDKFKSEARMSNTDMMYELQFLLMNQGIPESFFEEDSLNGLETSYLVANFLFGRAVKKESFIRFGFREPIVGPGDYLASKTTILSVRDRGYSREHSLSITAEQPVGKATLKKSYSYGSTTSPGGKIKKAGGFVTLSSPDEIPHEAMLSFVRQDLENQLSLDVFHTELDALIKEYGLEEPKPEQL